MATPEPDPMLCKPRREVGSLCYYAHICPTIYLFRTPENFELKATISIHTV